jgi:hypothetical protein
MTDSLYPLLGPRPRFDPNPGWDEEDWRCHSLERWVMSAPPREAVSRLVKALDDLDEHLLCRVGVGTLEALVNLNWDEIAESLVAALKTSSNLRRALSCVWFDADFDEGSKQRLQAFIQPHEDVGRRADLSTERDVWRPVHRSPIKEIRLTQLRVALSAATQRGLSNKNLVARIEGLAYKGAGDLLWTRFQCVPASGVNSAPFYRCGIMIWHRGQVAIEADLLVPDVDALSDAEPWRIAELLKHQMEGLPGIENV